MRSACALFLAVLLSRGVHAQGGIQGRVVNETGQGVRGANVAFFSLDRTAVSDSIGEFLLAGITAGRYMLSVRALGYSPLDVLVPIDSGNVNVIELSLKPVTLPTVEVRANGMPARYAGIARFEQFYERRARGVGTFFTRDQIASAQVSAAWEMLRRVNGARVSRNPYARDVKLDVRFARCGLSNLESGSKSPVAVYVDGLRISNAGAMITLDEFMTTEVEAMEVYVGPSQLPIEAMGDACAAVYIWTRFSSGTKK